LIWGAIVFAGLIACLEVVGRSNWLDQVLPVQSVGSYHAQFEMKWFKLQEYVQKNGGVDVILLGNSMVNTGIDPDVLAAHYKELTGKELRIFNFGVEGLTVAPMEKIAQILEDRYHPGTILLYTEMRDYIASNGVDVENQFLSNNWIQGQLGSPTLTSRLIDSSAALQHLLAFRNWSQTSFLDAYVTNVQRIENMSASGYEADHKTGKDVDKVPDPNDPAEQPEFALFKDYQVAPSRIVDLQSIIGLQSQGTLVLVTEFPAYGTYYRYTSTEAVAEYEKEIAAATTQAGGVYIPSVPYQLISLPERSDNHHLNYKGAPLYSNLLAEQLAGLCKDQQVCLAAARESRP
jgi:hypothetical protein